MGRRERWLELVISALEYHDGEASLSNIYQWIMENDSEWWSNYSDPDAQVRKTLYSYSSDADIYNDSNDDLFYSAEGKGQGVWGLRSKTQSWNGNFWWVAKVKHTKKLEMLDISTHQKE